MTDHSSSTLFSIILFVVALFTTTNVIATDSSERLDFDVFVNDKKIGTHVFELQSQDGIQEVRSTANFKYTFFFIPAFRYEHTNQERWADNCLIEFSARTTTNGDLIDVSGIRQGSVFRVERDAVPVELPECVMSFAYWNREFLREQRLLNPQTGEYVSVNVAELGEEKIRYRGNEVSATRFQLESPKASLTLWYSNDDEWLALESVAKGGRTIRYERV